MSAPGDYDRCHLALAFHVDSGDVDGVDVSGLTVVVLVDAPPLMSEGNWRVGMLMDASASQEQAEALGAVFSGQRGGPMEGLGPLIGEMLGSQVALIEYSNDGRRHRVRTGDAVDLDVEDFVSPLDPTGEGVKIIGVGFPVDTVAAGRATAARVNVLGLEWSNEGKNAFSAPFSWSA